MDYVIGRGVKDGAQVTVKVETDGKEYKVTCDRIRFEYEVSWILGRTVWVGGTYEAPHGSLLKAYYALAEFFKWDWEPEVHGEVEEIPYEEGVIY